MRIRSASSRLEEFALTRPYAIALQEPVTSVGNVIVQGVDEPLSSIDSGAVPDATEGELVIVASSNGHGVVVLLRDPNATSVEPHSPLPLLGLTEQTFAHRGDSEGGMITKRDVRVLSLGYLELHAGDVVFVKPDEIHQFRNTGATPLKFLCLVPNSSQSLPVTMAPECGQE